MARPKKTIDKDMVLKLATMHCTNVEIASFFECDVKTITNRFSKILTIGREQGKLRLRQLQWKAATKGNIKMLIWLGKQYLGQTENMKIQPDGELVIRHLYGKDDGDSSKT